jgi:hypothetical protein
MTSMNCLDFHNILTNLIYGTHLFSIMTYFNGHITGTKFTFAYTFWALWQISMKLDLMLWEYYCVFSFTLIYFKGHLTWRPKRIYTGTF